MPNIVENKNLKETTKIIEEDSEEESDDVYDSNSDDDDDDDNNNNNNSEEEENDDDDESDGFEVQSSSDESDYDDLDSEVDEDNVEVVDNLINEAESNLREWAPRTTGKVRSQDIENSKGTNIFALQQFMHTDDLSSDDEEDLTANTIGRVPLHWYDAYDHVGYDVTGSKVVKVKGRDRIDMAIAGKDDPEARRTVYDMYNNREVVLTEREMEMIRRMQAGAFAHAEHDDTPDYVDHFSSQMEVMPLSAAPEPKRRFVPSKWEMMKVMKIVKAIKEGRYVENNDEDKNNKNSSTFMIWDDEADDVLAESKKNKFHLPAPKMPLPGHAESYNPPAEYILTEDEKKQMEAMDPSDRLYNFIPKKHDCLRRVGGYQNFVKERFERCLDLYLCPRKMKRRLNIDPETLIPRLPKPRELKPFPNSLCLQYLGHTSRVTGIAISPDGQFLVSGSEDGTVRLWEVDTCLCRHIWEVGGPVVALSWNPSPSHHLVAVAVGKKVIFITTGTGDADGTEITDTLLSEVEDVAKKNSNNNENDSDSDSDAEVDSEDENEENKKKASKRIVAKWNFSSLKTSVEMKKESTLTKTRFGSLVGPRVEMILREEVTVIAWHHKGDYIATMAPTAGSQAVAIHQLSKAKTQCPFTKSPGKVQSISFHPHRPFLFVVTQQHIKIFHLVDQKLVKRLLSGCKWLSCVDVHPSGDHLIVGSYDRRVVWFDLDLSSTPYKTLKFHEKAVRSLSFHKRYPLMASASDDGSVHIFHSTVYSDLSRDPMIVPLKILKGHGVIGGMGVLSIVFHPRQPWIFTSGADGVINLFQDL
jgi:ribosome biogenesis protein ERB1